MKNMNIYGEVLYKSMRYIKSKVPSKRISKAFKSELVNYVRLWNLSIMLMYDEINNNCDNSAILIQYINLNIDMYSYIAINETEHVTVEMKTPNMAIHLMVKIIGEINAELCKSKMDLVLITRNLFALHNLPRCLMYPHCREYVSENDAVNYASGYLK